VVVTREQRTLTHHDSSLEGRTEHLQLFSPAKDTIVLVALLILFFMLLIAIYLFLLLLTSRMRKHEKKSSVILPPDEVIADPSHPGKLWFKFTWTMILDSFSIRKTDIEILLISRLSMG